MKIQQRLNNDDVQQEKLARLHSRIIHFMVHSATAEQSTPRLSGEEDFTSAKQYNAEER